MMVDKQSKCPEIELAQRLIKDRTDADGKKITIAKISNLTGISVGTLKTYSVDVGKSLPTNSFTRVAKLAEIQRRIEMEKLMGGPHGPAGFKTLLKKRMTELELASPDATPMLEAILETVLKDDQALLEIYQAWRTEE